MNEQSFEQLADQAASGLKSDRELYLDVKQELCAHLEEKAEHFVREGHSPEESAELSAKALGSPLDLAAELVDGNLRRMKFRSLVRRGFAALIVPIAIILALYVGYGRFARLEQLASGITGTPAPVRLPTLPLLDADIGSPEQTQVARQLAGGPEHAEDVRRYWEAHRRDPDSRMYYAYYAIFLESKDERAYARAMRLGERIEPQNAFYNVLLAQYYFNRGLTARSEKVVKRNETATDDLLDRRSFELGVNELRKAVKKPFMRTYQMDILRKKLNARPTPWLTEDYIQLVAVSSAEMFPHFGRYRNFARKVGGCARILLSEGRSADAEAVADTWKPLTKLVIGDSQAVLIQLLVANAAARTMTAEAGQIYDELGTRAKAREARIVTERLARVTKEWRQAGRSPYDPTTLQRHGSQLAAILLPVFGGFSPREKELTAGRMHEHVMMEEVFVQALLVLLMLALLGSLLQGAVWLFRLRRAESVPLLLMPPATKVVRSLLLGIILPMAVYWIYSRLPGIGGRQFSWGSGMWPRFAAELCILGIIMLWIPTIVIRRYIRRRCADLNIATPNARDEAATGWKVRAAFFAGIVVVAAIVCGQFEKRLILMVSLIAVEVVIIGFASWRVGAKRRLHGLYYGTLARSLAPIYAFSIILIATTLQPLQLYNEAQWLRRDTIVWGDLARRSSNAYFTPIERRATQAYSDLLLKAITGGEEGSHK